MSQRWLSRLSWFLGQNEDSERYAVAAVATLEPLGPGRDLAMAYSNLAQLRMLAHDVAEAVRWGEAAIGLARGAGSRRRAQVHALGAGVGAARVGAGDAAEGRARLSRRLDLALADDAHQPAARAYTNLGSTAVINVSWADADQYLKAGIAYCTDRDLDTWRLYMTAWLARSLAQPGLTPRRAASGRSCATRTCRRSPGSAPCPWPSCWPPGAAATHRRARRGAPHRRRGRGVPAARAGCRGPRRSGAHRRAHRGPDQRHDRAWPVRPPTLTRGSWASRPVG